MRQIALVERHVLDPDDAFVDLEFGDAIDEQERIAVLEDSFDRGVVERKRQVHRSLRLYCHRASNGSSGHPVIDLVIVGH